VPEVSVVKPEHEARAIDAIVLAFAQDPFARWVYPKPHEYLANCPIFTRAFAGRAFAHGTAHHVAGHSATALWLPPGVRPDEEALMSLVETSVAPDCLQDMFTMMAQMDGYHPEEPHWYLPLIGVDPAQQGRGYGSALLRHALARIDAEHAPAYLENTNPANTPLYARHGFEPIGSIQVEDGPPLLPMLRHPR
jgi:ribosomal protein S18 acetylase RimI-like enzyme